ncbi:cob(I)yrinic acid a,c-diamide adenosyltransferase [Opitutus sp. ER46]|uniref:cob(I)yrinic acid a,c-diamide adenosyltransferase n=1 Tax=Opitutus sp. ER46 TaxID=2161864 RepID=UPI000D30C092|nr:cob(I)yrinic acid a,c-diamide adenosyltransferase [Opitutus sp. ER46]PTX92385.1 cob(I)yrinic acid a,c-diamide adenosyltransferase [Opitutus sp. ER46]
MNDVSEISDPAAHRSRMAVVKAEMDARMAAARDRRGLVIVHTGDGKGKSTAAFGMVARTAAHGRRCAVIQFVKSAPDAVEKLLCGPHVTWHAVGEGFTWDTQDKAADIARCREGWRLAERYLQDPGLGLLLLDELNIALMCGYLELEDVVAAVQAKRPELHVVITGRGAPAELVALADLVTEMRLVKHPFNAGVKAQVGIEF